MGQDSRQSLREKNESSDFGSHPAMRRLDGPAWKLCHLITNHIKSAARRVAMDTLPFTILLLGEPFFWLVRMRHRRQERNVSSFGQVLIVRLDEIGDVVMTTPFLRELRRNLPTAHITLVVKPAIYNLVELCPYVNTILTYDWSWSLPGPLNHLQRTARALQLARKDLWILHLDLAVVPRWEADYYHAGFLAYFSGASRRLSYSANVTDVKRDVNRGFDHLFTDVLYDNTAKHEVEHNLDVIRALGCMVHDDRLELWLSPEDGVTAEEFLTSHAVHHDSFLIACGAGAGAPKRVWPLANFIELVQWLQKEYDAYTVVVGGPGDELLGQELHRQTGDRTINLAGRLTLRQTGAALKRCHLYVGNDAGPMHIAAAVGLSVVEISCHPRSGSPLHYNSPKRFGPWGVPHTILQPDKALDPCSDGCNAAEAHCICGITVEQVKQAIACQLAQQHNSFLCEKG